MEKSDLIITCTMYPEFIDQYVIAATGRIHMDLKMKELKDVFCKGTVKIIENQPVVKYKETITGNSDHNILGKSPNRLNRVYFQGFPLGEEVTKAVETKRITMEMEANERAKIMATEFKWDRDEAKKIWFLGPDTYPSNMVIEATKGVNYLIEVKEHIN